MVSRFLIAGQRITSRIQPLLQNLKTNDAAMVNFKMIGRRMKGKIKTEYQTIKSHHQPLYPYLHRLRLMEAQFCLKQPNHGLLPHEINPR